MKLPTTKILKWYDYGTFLFEIYVISKRPEKKTIRNVYIHTCLHAGYDILCDFTGQKYHGK